MKQKHQKETRELEKSYKNKMTSVELKYTTEIARMTLDGENKLKSLREELESIILGVKSEKNAEVRANEKLQE